MFGRELLYAHSSKFIISSYLPVQLCYITLKEESNIRMWICMTSVSRYTATLYFLHFVGDHDLNFLCDFWWAIQGYPSNLFFFLALQPPCILALIFQFHDHFTDGMTPWTSDQLVARLLPKHMTTQTQNKRIHTPNIHALCGIRTDDPGFRASEYSSCLIPLRYRGRRSLYYFPYF
jgi:hypothetical protein